MNHQPPRPVYQKVCQAAVRYRMVLAIVGALIGGFAYPVSRRVDFDRSIEAMFAADDPTLIAYQGLKESFGGNAVVMLVYEDPAFGTDEGLKDNEAISDRVEKVLGVAGVLSPAVLNRAVEKIRPASLFSKSPALFRRSDPVARGFLNLFAGYTHSADGKRSAVVAILKTDHSPATIESLKEIASELPAGQVALVGEPVLVHDGFSLIQRDGAKLATISILLLSIVLAITLHDLRLVVLAAVVIGWTVTVTKSALWMVGIELSLVSTILTAIVTVVTVTSVLHLGVRYRNGLRRGRARRVAVVDALLALSTPIFWTCATDAAGFAALAVSRILPVQQFGIMIAIASVAVFLALILFAPALMMIPSLPIAGGSIGKGRWNRTLRRMGLNAASWSVRHPAFCLVIGLLGVLVSALGLGRAEVETSFLNNFRPESNIVRDYASVESNFGGAGVWDVVLEAPAELTEPYLDSVRELEQRLRAIDVDGARLTKVISLADADSVVLKVRILKLVSPSTRLSGIQATMPVFFAALLADPDASSTRKFRIMLRSKEQLDSRHKNALIAEVKSVVAASDIGRSGQVTGYYVMMAELVAKLVGDQWRCFAASGLLVWGLLMLATRSIRLATSALLPNLLPVFLVLALIGPLGGKINMGAAMIAAVSIGLSIDGSVHFLAAYRRLRDRGYSSDQSAIHAAGNIGAPVVLATIALVIGFGAMTKSEFVPTATFGALVAATLMLGTVVNLTLLPAIVSRVDRTRVDR